MEGAQVHLVVLATLLILGVGMKYTIGCGLGNLKDGQEIKIDIRLSRQSETSLAPDA